MPFDARPRFYVYMLLDPRKNNQPFYVGKGCGDRINLHERFKDCNKNTFKDRTIKAIHKKGLKIKKVKVADNLTELEAYELEESLIVKYGRRHLDDNGILTNITLQFPPPGRKRNFTEEELKRAQETLKLQRTGKTYEEIYGDEFAAEIKKKQSASSLGCIPWNKGKAYPHSEEHKHACSISARRRVNSNPQHKQELINRCLENAKKNKGRKYTDAEKEKRFISFVRKNEEIIRRIFLLWDNNVRNKSEISRKVGCLVDRVIHIIKNSEKILEYLGEDNES